MHELSLADAIVRVACDHAGERRVTRVEVKVGRLRQVVPSALEFAFELVAQGTVAEGAELCIEDVRAAGRCRACGERGELTAFPLQCAACGALDMEVTDGEELLVDALVLEDVFATKEG